MIYSYNYINHPIQKFHEGMMFFFGKMIELDLTVYDENQLLEEWFRPLVNKSPSTLKGEMEEIVKVFHLLPSSDKTKVKLAFENNQNIEEICKGNIEPKKFDFITDKTFRELLKNFFESLWSRLGKKGDGVNGKVIEECKTIMDHFSTFREDTKHKMRLCPFCCLNPLKPSFGVYRNAYDHYLPKAQYPFVSVNFKNLVPVCHECNSDEKGTADTPFYDTGERRTVYYPFDNTIEDDHFEPQIAPEENYDSELRSTLLKDINWKYSLKSQNNEDVRLNSWDQIFQIKRRYKEQIVYCEKAWFDDLIVEYKKAKNEGKSFHEIRTSLISTLKSEIMKSERSVVQYSYYNFLLNQDGIEEDLESFIV